MNSFANGMLPLTGLMFLLVTSSTSRLWADEPPPDLSGKYSCKGQDVGGAKYDAVVEITKNGDVYNLKWTLANGLTFIGVGIQEEKSLSVSWVSRTTAGVMIYKLQDNGTLVGRWALVNGKGTVQKEVLTPVS